MGEVSGNFLPVGARYAQVFALNSDGYPDASAATVYTGLTWGGPKAFSLSVPEPRRFDHTGKDQVLQTVFLPPLQGLTAKLNVSDYRFDILGLVTGITVTTVGEAKEIAHGTNRQGKEPLVGLMLYQQAQDLDTGELRWRAIVIPKARCIPAPGGMGDSPEDMVFNIAPAVVTKRLWGAPLSLASNKYTRAQVFEYMTEGEPRLYPFKADGVAKDFAFPTGETALATDKLAVFKNGVAVTEGITLATDKVSFAAAPTADDMICVWSELE